MIFAHITNFVEEEDNLSSIVDVDNQRMTDLGYQLYVLKALGALAQKYWIDDIAKEDIVVTNVAPPPADDEVIKLYDKDANSTPKVQFFYDADMHCYCTVYVKALPKAELTLDQVASDEAIAFRYWGLRKHEKRKVKSLLKPIGGILPIQ